MRFLWNLAIILALAVPVTGVVLLADAQTTAEAAKGTFSNKERTLIEQFFTEQNAKGNHKAKNKGLPPGILRKLEAGKPLPPGIQMTRLPPALEKQLPPPPSGTERIIVDTYIVLIDRTTHLIVDVLREVIDRR